MASAGRTPERSRYTVPGAERAWEHAAAEADDFLEEFTAVGVEQGGWLRRSDFPEVPKALILPELWRVAKFDTWSFHEDIMLREGRALMYALKRIGRSKKTLASVSCF